MNTQSAKKKTFKRKLKKEGGGGIHLSTWLQSPQPPTYTSSSPLAPHSERNRMKWHYAYENVQKDVWFMYALDANSITGHKALVRFLSEHSAALIKPDLINSDTGRKIEGAKERELEEIYNPDTDLKKKMG